MSFFNLTLNLSVASTFGCLRREAMGTLWQHFLLKWTLWTSHFRVEADSVCIESEQYHRGQYEKRGYFTKNAKLLLKHHTTT